MIVINIPEILLKTHDCVHNIWAIPQTHIYRQCTIAAQTWKLQKYRVHMLYALNNNYTQPDNDT